MANNLIDVQSLKPEILGMRLTVYHLLSDFLNPNKTEGYISSFYNLTPEQVAAARAYILNNPETVLSRHLQIEERIARGNPPEVIEQAKKTHETFMKFKEWLIKQRETETTEESAVRTGESASSRLPAFREWLAGQTPGS